MLDWLPFPLVLALLLCLPIWGVTELVDEVLKRAGVKDAWWGWLLLRLVPPLAGVGLVFLPGIVDLVVELLGLDGVVLVMSQAIAYGVLAGFVAQVLHAWGLRPGIEAAIRAFATSKLKLPTVILPLLVFMVSCGAAWPKDKCTLGGEPRMWQCQCKEATFTISGTAPAGVIILDCDGSPLPVVVRGQKVVTP